MTEFVTREALIQVAEVVDAPQVRREIDRSFELPTGLYVATAGLYLGFVAVMAAAFLNPGLVVPLSICAVFIAAAFGTPSLWARMRPETPQRALSWSAFRNRGIQTATGRLDAGAAAVQVLILPALILLWGVAVAIIAAATT